jgi:hypothetical protein
MTLLKGKRRTRPFDPEVTSRIDHEGFFISAKSLTLSHYNYSINRFNKSNTILIT